MSILDPAGDNSWWLEHPDTFAPDDAPVMCENYRCKREADCECNLCTGADSVDSFCEVCCSSLESGVA